MKRTITLPTLMVLFCISGVSEIAAQSESAKPCQLDLELSTGRTVTDYLYVNLILIEDHTQSSELVQYIVRGNGFYETVAGESGRLWIASGSWDNTTADVDRYISVIFLNGAKANLQYTINLPWVVNGTVSGSWIDDNNSVDSGSARGTTTCDQ